MPSRPVLIGRGLVLQTLNKTHQSASRPHHRQEPTSTTTQCLDTPRVHTTASRVIRQSYGGHSERETPGPIPNPEVKPFSADGTATARLWESRTPPDLP